MEETEKTFLWRRIWFFSKYSAFAWLWIETTQAQERLPRPYKKSCMRWGRKGPRSPHGLISEMGANEAHPKSFFENETWSQMHAGSKVPVTKLGPLQMVGLLLSLFPIVLIAPSVTGNRNPWHPGASGDKSHGKDQHLEQDPKVFTLSFPLFPDSVQDVFRADKPHSLPPLLWALSFRRCEL